MFWILNLASSPKLAGKDPYLCSTYCLSGSNFTLLESKGPLEKDDIPRWDKGMTPKATITHFPVSWHHPALLVMKCRLLWWWAKAQLGEDWGRCCNNEKTLPFYILASLLVWAGPETPYPLLPGCQWVAPGRKVCPDLAVKWNTCVQMAILTRQSFKVWQTIVGNKDRNPHSAITNCFTNEPSHSDA